MQTTARQRPPALQGTEKQIAWAEKIRASALRDVTETFDQFDDAFGWAIEQGKATQAQADAAREALEAYRADLLSQTQAGWWIDQRGTLDRPRHIVTISRLMEGATQSVQG